MTHVTLLQCVITLVNDSCHALEMSHVTLLDESRHIWQSHIWTSHVTYKGVMSHCARSLCARRTWMTRVMYEGVTYVTWLIHMWPLSITQERDVTRPTTAHDSFICDPEVWPKSATWLVQPWRMTHSYVTLKYDPRARHDSSNYGAWLIHMWLLSMTQERDVTRPTTAHDSFICDP